LKTLSELEGN